MRVGEGHYGAARPAKHVRSSLLPSPVLKYASAVPRTPDEERERGEKKGEEGIWGLYFALWRTNCPSFSLGVVLMHRSFRCEGCLLEPEAGCPPFLNLRFVGQRHRGVRPRRAARTVYPGV